MMQHLTMVLQLKNYLNLRKSYLKLLSMLQQMLL